MQATGGADRQSPIKVFPAWAPVAPKTEAIASTPNAMSARRRRLIGPTVISMKHPQFVAFLKSGPLRFSPVAVRAMWLTRKYYRQLYCWQEK